MLETMGHALIPNVGGVFGGKRKKSERQVDSAPADAKAADSATREGGAADDDGDDANVWGRLLNGGGLSQKDIEWVRIKSFMDEKKR